MVTYITDVLICKFFYGKNYPTMKEFPLFTLTRLKYVTAHSLIAFLSIPRHSHSSVSKNKNYLLSLYEHCRELAYLVSESESISMGECCYIFMFCLFNHTTQMVQDLTVNATLIYKSFPDSATC